MVLGSNHTRRGRGEISRPARRFVPGPRQLGRSLSPQPQLSIVRPHAAHAHRALQRRVQLLRPTRVRGLQLHRRSRRTFNDRFPVWRILLFSCPHSRLPIVSGSSCAARVAVRAGADSAVSLSVLYSAVHPRRPYPAPASTNQHQRLAWRRPVLVLCRILEYWLPEYWCSQLLARPDHKTKIQHGPCWKKVKWYARF